MGGDQNAFVVITNHLNNLNIYKGLVHGQNLKHITIDSLPQIIKRLNNNRSLLIVNTDLIKHQRGSSKTKKLMSCKQFFRIKNQPKLSNKVFGQVVTIGRSSLTAIRQHDPW